MTRAEADCTCETFGNDPCPCEADGADGLCACCRIDDHNGSCGAPPPRADGSVPDPDPQDGAA